MGMDKNTVIGFTLIGLLLIGMLYFNSKSNLTYQADQKRIEDSIARLHPKTDTMVAKADSLRADSLRKLQSAAGFNQTINKSEQLFVLENELIKVTFTNKGAQPKTVELKKYKTFNGKPVLLQDGNFNSISYPVFVTAGHTEPTNNLYFQSEGAVKNTDNSQTLSFSLKDSSGKEIIHHYTIHPGDYLIDFTIDLHEANSLISQNIINLTWQSQTRQVERDLKYEKQQTHICYLTEDKYDYNMMGNSGSEKKFDNGVNWLAIKQQFFISSLINKNKFGYTDVAWVIPDTTTHLIAQTVANCKINVQAGVNNTSVPLQLYYGPSDYDVLKKYDNKMENIVPLGSGVFAFVKYINRYLLLPAFNFLSKNVASMGIVILLLTLLIRVITSPILYKSYVSGAKMRALKPEIDLLRAKYGDDKQAMGVEQMKLWKSAGVNPLGGCLPALLQIPIFMSLYYFFQSNIALRGHSFLWAKDLAQYDSIANLPFSIPFYGDHISLFTLTATATSLLISIYSMSTVQDDSNPMMKYMPYIFPVLLLGVFNGLPSALTWYYTVSNTITLILQIVIQKYIIDHDKILAQIEENKKKPVKQSKLQERLQAMQDANKKLQDMKGKSHK